MDNDVYNAADIYYLSKRHVEGTEKRRLENRMMWILTGEEQYWKDSNAIGREAGAQKKIEDAQKKTLGTKRIKKKKGKGSNFFKRPDKRFTERRRAKALSNTKSDMQVD